MAELLVVEDDSGLDVAAATAAPDEAAVDAPVALLAAMFSILLPSSFSLSSSVSWSEKFMPST